VTRIDPRRIAETGSDQSLAETDATCPVGVEVKRLDRMYVFRHALRLVLIGVILVIFDPSCEAMIFDQSGLALQGRYILDCFMTCFLLTVLRNHRRIRL